MPRIDKISSEKHEGDVTCVLYHNNQVFSSGADGKIKIWDRDLNLVKTVDAHTDHIYTIAINEAGKIYSCSSDGYLKFTAPPYDTSQELFCFEDAIQSLYIDGDALYTGDSKGLVTNWKDDRRIFVYNIVEEVKSLAAEKNLIYTVRDFDICVSDIVNQKTGRYTNKAVLPGKSPLTLLGPIVDGKRSYLAFPDRSGLGLSLVKNLPTYKFDTIWTLQNCHEMIVLALCGDEKNLYSGGYDKIVKGWTELDQSEPQPLGEVDVGSIINSITCGADNNVYIATSEGLIKRTQFI